MRVRIPDMEGACWKLVVSNIKRRTVFVEDRVHVVNKGNNKGSRVAVLNEIRTNGNCKAGI